MVLCTDGVANVGVGSFGYGRGNNNAGAFYDRIGRVAEEAGVTINLITFTDCQANIAGLSQMVELSGGQIEQVNPNELGDDMSLMLQRNTIATKVEATVLLHKGLQFRNELEKDLSRENTQLTRRFGNVSAETMFTFEYGMKPISQLLAMEDVDMQTQTHFPFQTQIHFTALDGSKCLRVISQKLEVSNEREELEQVADAELVQQNCMMQGARQARAGNTKKAQAIMKTFNRKVKNIDSEQFQEARTQLNVQSYEVYNAIGAQRKQVSMPAQTQMPQQRGSMMMKSKKKTAMPRQSMPAQAPMDDRMSAAMFQMSTKSKRSKF